jgi:hypothetical protein
MKIHYELEGEDTDYKRVVDIKFGSVMKAVLLGSLAINAFLLGIFFIIGAIFTYLP